MLTVGRGRANAKEPHVAGEGRVLAHGLAGVPCHAPRSPHLLLRRRHHHGFIAADCGAVHSPQGGLVACLLLLFE
jgi:hypothetical protein